MAGVTLAHGSTRPDSRQSSAPAPPRRRTRTTKPGIDGRTTQPAFSAQRDEGTGHLAVCHRCDTKRRQRGWDQPGGVQHQPYRSWLRRSAGARPTTPEAESGQWHGQPSDRRHQQVPPVHARTKPEPHASSRTLSRRRGSGPPSTQRTTSAGPPLRPGLPLTSPRHIGVTPRRCGPGPAVPARPGPLARSVSPWMRFGSPLLCLTATRLPPVCHARLRSLGGPSSGRDRGRRVVWRSGDPAPGRQDPDPVASQSEHAEPAAMMRPVGWRRRSGRTPRKVRRPVYRKPAFVVPARDEPAGTDVDAVKDCSASSWSAVAGFGVLLDLCGVGLVEDDRSGGDGLVGAEDGAVLLVEPQRVD